MYSFVIFCSIIGVFGSNIDLNTSLLGVKQNIPNAVLSSSRGVFSQKNYYRNQEVKYLLRC